MKSALTNCRNQSPPVEYAAIHLKDYSLKYFVGTTDNAVPLISKSERGVILIKIYLIKWD